MLVLVCLGCYKLPLCLIVELVNKGSLTYQTEFCPL